MISFYKVFILGLKQIKKWVIDEDYSGTAISIVFFSLTIPYAMIRWNDLNNYGNYTVGIIYDVGYNGKGPERNFYEFWINGNRYIGQESRGVTNIRTGDSVFIEYDRNNPKNNAIVGYFEYTLDRSKLPDTVYYRRQMNSKRKPLNYHN